MRFFHGNWRTRTLHEWAFRPHRIKATLTSWMTTQDALEGHPSATQPSMLMQRDCGVFGAGGLKAACSPGHSCTRMQNRREHEFVDRMDGPHKRYAETVLLVHALFSGFALRAASMTAKIRPTSPSRRVRSICRTLLRGCRTTSTSDCKWPRFLRTTSRMRRLMRLRSTALPSTRPAVRPIRGPLTSCVLSARKQKKYVIEAENCLRLC